MKISVPTQKERTNCESVSILQAYRTDGYRITRSSKMRSLALISILFALSNRGGASSAGCGSEGPVIFTNSTGNISSPGYHEGKNYPAFLTSSYTIKAPKGQKIRLTFEDMDIEEYDLCGGDVLEIYEGEHSEGSVIGKFCGQERPFDILSILNSLHLVFKTDFIGSGKGFHISYRFTTDVLLCGEDQMQCKNRNCVHVFSRCNGTDDCGDGTDEEYCPGTATGGPNSVPCGTPSILPAESDLERIVGGEEAIPHSWPWQASVQILGYEPSGHNCGGTLINDQWVLTAAHCFINHKNSRDWKVVLGSHRKFRREKEQQTRYVTKLIPFPYTTEPRYSEAGYLDIENDIALMKLSNPVIINEFVRPICLPQLGEGNRVIDVPTTTCFATGWGQTRGTGHFDVLKQTRLEILDGEHCHNPVIAFNNKTMLCAGVLQGGQGMCQGDSGGPLVCKSNDQWHLVGVTSALTHSNRISSFCGVKEKPSIFTKVAFKLYWIMKTLSDNQ